METPPYDEITAPQTACAFVWPQSLWGKHAPGGNLWNYVA